jgi:DHA3 family macrolide efflux protein-like MFS transporter
MMEYVETVETAVPAPENRLSNTFYLIWFGQSISMIGAMLTSFGFGVWLFQSTGSVLNFVQLTLASTLPALLLLPWSGSLADRYNKRTILIVCDLVALVCTGLLCLLVWGKAFSLWQLYAVQITLSICMAFQGPAAYATLTSIVDKENYGRASGMFGSASAVAQLSAPMMAATLLALIGLHGILAIEIGTLLLALAGLLLATFPPVPPRDAQLSEARRPMRDLAWAFKFLWERPSMARIFAYTSMGAFLSGMVIVLVTPMVLSNHSAAVLARISTAGAVGALLSGLLMISWGGPRKWTPLLLGLNLVEGLAVAIGGTTKSVAVLTLCAFVVMFCTSMLAGCIQAIWRRKVPRERQGNFAALQQAIGLSLIPLSAVVGGLLVQYLFEPSLMAGGAWFDSVGSWFGTGKGRGTGLFFLVAGSLVAAISVYSLVDRRVHRLEAEVEDAF